MQVVKRHYRSVLETYRDLKQQRSFHALTLITKGDDCKRNTFSSKTFWLHLSALSVIYVHETVL